MWADTCLKNVGRKLVIWDNCGPHKVDAVRAVFKEHGIAVVELPPNMTDRLQVIDLVTNGPLKSGMRRKRVSDLYDYMVTWRSKRSKALTDGEPLPSFDPPKPNAATALQNLFTVELQVSEKAALTLSSWSLPTCSMASSSLSVFTLRTGCSRSEPENESFSATMGRQHRLERLSAPLLAGPTCSRTQWTR